MCCDIVPARAMHMEVFDGPGRFGLACTHIHNYGLSSSQMKAIEDAHLSSCRPVQGAPHFKTFAFVGDFNIQPVSEPRIVLSTPNPLATFCTHSCPFEARWNKLFDELT